MYRGRNEEGEGRQKNSTWRSAASLSDCSRLNWTVAGLETTCTYVTFHVESNGEIRFGIEQAVPPIKSGNEVKIRVRSKKAPYFPLKVKTPSIFLLFLIVPDM